MHMPDPGTPIEETLGALAARPAVASVIAGATKPEQVARNVAAGSWVPDAAIVAAIDRVTAESAHG
jgi:aryl-alcohol dehydrogenase-like predicted oxidoreductase